MKKESKQDRVREERLHKYFGKGQKKQNSDHNLFWFLKSPLYNHLPTIMLKSGVRHEIFHFSYGYLKDENCNSFSSLDILNLKSALTSI